LICKVCRYIPNPTRFKFCKFFYVCVFNLVGFLFQFYWFFIVCFLLLCFKLTCTLLVVTFFDCFFQLTWECRNVGKVCCLCRSNLGGNGQDLKGLGFNPFLGLWFLHWKTKLLPHFVCNVWNVCQFTYMYVGKVAKLCICESTM
jgi:hypothetical protein